MRSPRTPIAHDANDAARPRRQMVGRRGELAQLVALMSDAGEGNGGAALVRGDPGIGKSTLLQETAAGGGQPRILRDDRARARFRRDARDAGGRQPVRAPAAGMHRRSRAKRALAAALASGDLPRELALFAADLLSLPRSADDLALYRAMDEAMRESGRTRALQALLAAAARRRPQLIIVEDVHWADDSLLRTLSLLAAGLAGSAALILMSSRADGDPIDAAWRGRARDALLATIDLRPLSGNDAGEAGASPLDRVRGLSAPLRGARGRQPAVPGTAAAQPGDRPGGTSAAVGARRGAGAAGPPGANRIAARSRPAAILGQRFDLADLRALTGDKAYECGELARRHLVRPDGIADRIRARADPRRSVRLADARTAGPAAPRRRGVVRRARSAVQAEHLERAAMTARRAAYLRAAKAEAALLHMAVALGAGRARPRHRAHRVRRVRTRHAGRHAAARPRPGRAGARQFQQGA